MNDSGLSENLQRSVAINVGKIDVNPWDSNEHVDNWGAPLRCCPVQSRCSSCISNVDISSSSEKDLENLSMPKIHEINFLFVLLIL